MTRGVHLLGELVTGWVGSLGAGVAPVINVNRDRSPVRCAGGLAELRRASVAQWRAVLDRFADSTDKDGRKMAELARGNLAVLGEPL